MLGRHQRPAGQGTIDDPVHPRVILWRVKHAKKEKTRIGYADIHFYIFPIYGLLRTHKVGQLPGGLIAQLVEHCTGIEDVMGSNPVQT